MNFIQNLFKIFNYFKCPPKHNFHESRYRGFDIYKRKWHIAIDQNQQLWAITHNKKICNAGYFKPYRNFLILNQIINWKNTCHKN